MNLKLSVLVFLLIFTPSVFSSSHYSYENAIKLKPLVDWHSYSPNAFNKAVKENKPIFLLLTAPSWCYWCQVYESEDYLFNKEVVSMLNENFIPI